MGTHRGWGLPVLNELRNPVLGLLGTGAEVSNPSLCAYLAYYSMGLSGYLHLLFLPGQPWAGQVRARDSL